MLFSDRHKAGKLLSASLQSYKDKQDVIVLGLARGGVVVAYEVAKALSVPLNVVVPRKIGAPGNPELALGSIMETGSGYFNHELIEAFQVPQSYLLQEIEKEKKLAAERVAIYRQALPAPILKNMTVILVDDGIATGATMLSCVQWAQSEAARRIVIATPVASTQALHILKDMVDNVFCLYSRDYFGGVGLYYEYFPQVENEEVVLLLKQSKNDDANSI